MIREEGCKGCGLCVAVCPQRIIMLAELPNTLGYRPAMVLDQDRCTSCSRCAIMCPDLVIEVHRPVRASIV